MINAGNIIGFGFGFLPLAELPIIRHLGGDQFSRFCIICIVILVVTVGMTCFCHHEQERPEQQQTNGTVTEVLDNIWTALINMPKAIRRVCYVQLFAFMGWFPFLFYSTTYVGQVMAYELQKEPNAETATRTGEFAMLLYSIVGVVAGTILPHLVSRDRRLLAHKTDVNQNAEINRLRETVRVWRVEAASKGGPLRLPVMPFLLRNIWTGALLFFSLLMFSTFFITTVFQATVFISFVGICWAVAMWVPFSIIMELLKEGGTPVTPPISDSGRRPGHARNMSFPGHPRPERQPLLRRRSFDEDYDYEPPREEVISTAPIAGGTILGLHNLAIVMPQFIVALITSVIFRIVDEAASSSVGENNTYLGHNGVAWVLRFGGCCTLVGALVSRMVPPTAAEKAMRRRLGEMKLLEQEGRP